MRRTAAVCVLLLVGSFVAHPVRAQSPNAPSSDAQKAQVRATIDRLFDAMRQGDSTGVRAVFAEGATLHTVGGTENASGESPETLVRSTPVPGFAEAVGQPREEAWDERIWDVVIRIDGDLAAAWVPYAFYLGPALQHCGVNAMQLVRHPEGWKILHLTDTRTPAEDCSMPASVRKEAGR
jgi:hypothetical protein